jgi:hypothetical protein
LHLVSCKVGGVSLKVTVLPLLHNPELLATENGTYNCSVDYYGEFKDLFACDLEHQCAGGEDETGCAFTQSGCSNQAVTYQDDPKCYK